MTTDHMRVQPELDPHFALETEGFFLFRIELQRLFDGKVHIPAAMVHAVDPSEPALANQLLDLVQIKDHVTRLPYHGRWIGSLLVRARCRLRRHARDRGTRPLTDFQGDRHGIA